MNITLPKLYAITDRRLSGISHLEQVKRLVDGGAKLIQLREKDLLPGEWIDDARRSLQYCRIHGVTLIVNDRVDLALVIDADGVHLGQTDIPVEAARRLLDADSIIGLSTHTLAQASLAITQRVDYIAFGPVFPTSTKVDTDPVVGLELLSDICRIAGSIPVVAIGGINRTNVDSVISAGAASVAVISDLISDPSNIAAHTREFIAKLSNNV